MSDKTSFTDAVNALYGGEARGVKARMAEDFKVSRQTIHNWSKKGQVPQSVTDAMKEKARG